MSSRNDRTIAEFHAAEQLEEAAASLGWSIAYRQLRRGRFSARLEIVGSGSTAIALERFRGNLHVGCTPPPGYFGVFLLGLGQGRVTVDGREVGDDELVTLPEGSHMDFVTCGVVRDEVLFLPQEEFRARAARLLGQDVAFAAGLGELRRGDAAGLQRLRRSIRRSVLGGSFDAEAESQLLAQLVLWLDASEPSESSERSARAAAASAAREYIEERFRGPVQLDDLCAHVGVSLRTLQRSFAESFQVRPTEYLRVRRLNEARRLLLAADPGADRVTGIALGVGFTHLGRFSREYRGLFGESPSRTLASREADPSAF